MLLSGVFQIRPICFRACNSALGRWCNGARQWGSCLGRSPIVANLTRKRKFESCPVHSSLLRFGVAADQ